MLKANKRYIALALTIVFFLFFLFYSNHLFSRIGGYFAKNYIAAQFGVPIRFESAFFQNSTLILEKVETEGELFQAEKVEVALFFNFWEKTLHLKLHLAAPVWFLSEEFTKKEAPIKALFSKDKKQTFLNFEVVVDQGTLRWKEAEKIQQASLETVFNAQKGGKLKVGLQDENASSFLEIYSHTEKGTFKCDCRLLEMNCKSFLTLLKLFGVGDQTFAVQSGLLNGHLTAYFPKTKRPQFEGKIEIKDFCCTLASGMFKGGVEEALLTLKRSKESASGPSILGSLECVTPGFFKAKNWSCNQILGTLRLEDSGRLLFDFETEGNYQEEVTGWEIEGLVQLNPTKQFEIALNAFSLGQGSEIHLAMKRNKLEKRVVEADVNLLSFEDYRFLEGLFCEFIPFKPLRFHHQGINAKIGLEFDAHGKGKFSVSSFYLTGLELDSKRLGLSLIFESVFGKVEGRLGEDDFLSSMLADVHFEKGSSFFEKAPMLSCSELSAHLFVKPGGMARSTVFLGSDLFHGTLIGVWNPYECFLDCRMSTESKTLISFLPEKMKKKFSEEIKNFPTHFYCRFDRLNNSFKGQGIFQLMKEQSADRIQFTLSLDDEEWKKDLLKGIKIDCYASDLPANEYLSPIIFQKGDLKLSGKAEIGASLKNGSLSIGYNLDEGQIESKDLKILCPSLRGPPGEFLGRHVFDCTSFEHSGSLPITHASYFQKTKQLLFEDVQGLALFKGKIIELNQFDASIEGISLSGGLVFDYSDPKPETFDLKVSLNEFSGKISHIKQILQKIGEKSFLDRLPFEGNFSSRGHGVDLSFSFFPEDYSLFAHGQGSIFDGVIDYDGFLLRQLSTNFDYDHEKKILDLTSGEGIFLEGKNEEIEEYDCLFPRVVFHDFSDPEIKGDFALTKKGKEYVRAVFETKTVEKGLQSVMIDKERSHIGALYPNTFECLIDDWKRLKSFKCSSSFSLSDFFKDAALFKPGKLYSFFSSEAFQKAEGGGELKIDFDPKDDAFFFDLEGVYLSKEGEKDTFSFFCKQTESKWIVEDFNWKKWSGFGEVTKQESGYAFSSLGISCGNSLLGIFEGTLSKNGDVRTSIKKGRLILEDPEHRFLTYKFCALSSLKGCLSFEGSAFFRLQNMQNWENSVEIDLLASCPCLSAEEAKIDFQKPFRLLFKAPLSNLFLDGLEGSVERKGEVIAFREGTFLYTPDAAHFSAKMQDKEWKIEGKIEIPECGKGLVRIYENENTHFSLSVDWKTNQEKLFLIDSIQGSFKGALFDLTRHSSSKEDKNLVYGSVKLDLPLDDSPASIPFLDLLKQNEIKGSCFFEGFLTFPASISEMRQGAIENISGKIVAENCSLKGCQFNLLSSTVFYQPGHIELEKIEVSDPAGLLNIDSLSLKKGTFDDWHGFIPRIRLENFKFSSLKGICEDLKKDKHFSKLSAFVVESMEIENFSGQISDQTTWLGTGSLSFTNTSKKSNFYPLFAVPRELFLRVGLDPQVMHPIKGTILFDLQADRFYLRKLKDAYSPGKSTRFYLDLNSEPSWIDFQGHLKLHLKTKQYNLIFKVLEPFTLTVEGECLKPHYHFHR